MIFTSWVGGAGVAAPGILHASIAINRITIAGTTERKIFDCITFSSQQYRDFIIGMDTD
jgi:hypothetical protein